MLKADIATRSVFVELIPLSYYNINNNINCITNDNINDSINDNIDDNINNNLNYNINENTLFVAFWNISVICILHPNRSQFRNNVFNKATVQAFNS